MSGIIKRDKRKPPSQTWKTFVSNHMKDMAAIDFLVVPTIRFKMLFVFVVLSHDRRKVIHFNVTANPTAQWTAQQIVEAFPWDGAAEIQHQNICCEIGTRFSASASRAALGPWELRKF